MKSKKGFTLAEVLVTLAVIGVVAALTIPTIIQNSQEKQAKTSIKKALSVTNQILSLSIAENGIGGSSVNNSAVLYDIFKDYMKVMVDDSTNYSFTTADGMVYSFYKVNDDIDIPCGNLDNPKTAECLIEIDINGNSGNEVPGTTDSYNDLYYLIIQNNAVVPANGQGDWQPSTVATFRAGISGSSVQIDDVTREAILN